MTTGRTREAGASKDASRTGCRRAALGLVAGLSVVAALAAVEGLVRLRQWYRIGSAGVSRYASAIDPVSGLTIATPGQKTPRISINALGFRGPELQMPKPAGRIRVAFLGASTTFCAEVSGNAATWPHLVTERLGREWPAASFDYVNAALPGYRVETNRRNLEYRVRPTEPDVIVFYEAMNDLAVDVRRLADRQGVPPDDGYEERGPRSWSVAWSLVENNIRLLARRRRAAREQVSSVRFAPSELSRPYQARLDRFVAEAQQAAPVVAIATFSQKVRREQPLDLQLRYANTYLFYLPQLSMADIVRAFDEYNRVIREVARTRGVILIDGEDGIPADDVHFIDSVHFTDAGARAMADRIASVLVADPGVRRLVEQASRISRRHENRP